MVVIDQLQDNKIVQTMHKYTYNNAVTPINETKIKTAIKTTTKGNNNDPYRNGSGNPITETTTMVIRLLILPIFV